MSETRKVYGGIYKDKGVPTAEADFMIYYNNSLSLIYDDISDIFGDVEHAESLNRYELLEGYALAVVVDKVNDTNELGSGKWQIRNSGLKYTDKYVIGEGTYRAGFVSSLAPFFKLMS